MVPQEPFVVAPMRVQQANGESVVMPVRLRRRRRAWTSICTDTAGDPATAAFTRRLCAGPRHASTVFARLVWFQRMAATEPRKHDVSDHNPGLGI